MQFLLLFKFIRIDKMRVTALKKVVDTRPCQFTTRPCAIWVCYPYLRLYPFFPGHFSSA